MAPTLGVVFLVTWIEFYEMWDQTNIVCNSNGYHTSTYAKNGISQYILSFLLIFHHLFYLQWPLLYNIAKILAFQTSIRVSTPQLTSGSVWQFWICEYNNLWPMKISEVKLTKIITFGVIIWIFLQTIASLG